jgi:hypothetical protein
MPSDNCCWTCRLLTRGILAHGTSAKNAPFVRKSGLVQVSSSIFVVKNCHVMAQPAPHPGAATTASFVSIQEPTHRMILASACIDRSFEQATEGACGPGWDL